MIDDYQFQKRAKRSFTVPTIYTHNCFSSMFHGILNWISDEFYPRFEYKVVTTYDKAVEFFTKKKQNPDGQVQTNVLPCITLDPILDFSNEERAGRFLWMFENLDSGRGKNLFSSINLRDQGVSITPIFTRYQGTIELTSWFASIYELIDFRVKLIQYCGGFQRWIRPKFFWTHLILPKELVEFEGPNGKLDWSHTNQEIITLETTNTKEYAYPFLLNAIWRLDSFSDSSNKMGADQVSEWKLNAGFTWEAMIPTFFRVDNYDWEKFKIVITVGTAQTYTAQPLISGFKLLRSIDKIAMLENMIDEFPIYNICDDGASPIIKFDDTQCTSYPDRYSANNHYVRGKILVIDGKKKIPEIKDFETILVFKKFKEEYIPHLRKCKGAISRDDDSTSEFYTFCSGLGMSFICNIKDNSMYDFIVSLDKKEVTFDPIGQLIYSGIREVKKYNQINDMDLKKFVFTNNVLKILERYNLESQIKDSARLPFSGSVVTNRDLSTILKSSSDLANHEYDLPYIIPESAKSKIDILINDNKLTEKEYKIEHNNKLIISDSVVINPTDVVTLVRNNMTVLKDIVPIINYAMTKTDERNYYTEKKLIKIEIPENIEKDSIVCCSYIGLMDKNVDYLIDNNKIVFNLEPMRDRVIQVFGFKK